MMIYGMFGQDYWELRHKVTFDGENKLIVVNEGETEIDIETDIYSDWKEWTFTQANLKWDAALRTVGGDATPTGGLGATFFTINGWRILIDHGVNFIGNIYSDDFNSPILTVGGTELATLTVSNLIDKVLPDASDNAKVFV